MTYNPDTMPATIDEWNELIAFKTNESKAAYDAAVAQAKAQALAVYAKLTDSEDKPSQMEYVAQAVALVPRPIGSEEWEQTFRAAGYYPQAQPLFAEPEPTAAEKRAQALAAIDAATSQAILAGFDYALNGQQYHFAYDEREQQNFADMANACLLARAGLPGAPERIEWNATGPDGAKARLALSRDEFLALYVNGALAHKEACRAHGRQQKAALEGAAA